MGIEETSHPLGALGQLGEPATWLPHLRRSLRRIAPAEDRAEIESLAVLILWRQKQAGRPVRDFHGFVRTVVLNTLYRTRARRECRGIDYGIELDLLAAPPKP